jgi:hypothetical protein
MLWIYNPTLCGPNYMVKPIGQHSMNRSSTNIWQRPIWFPRWLFVFTEHSFLLDTL